MNIEPVDYKYQLKSESSFKTEIKGYKVESDYYSLDVAGWLSLKKGYAWNGATAAIDSEDFMNASAIHDAFYQMIAQGELPEAERISADEELRRFCIAAGMTRLRAQYVYLAVRVFGGFFARKK